MKRPRDISTKFLITALSQFGYSKTRQVGSHIRLTTEVNGQHHITIPYKKQLAIGKINAVLWDLVQHFHMDRAEVMRLLFGAK